MKTEDINLSVIGLGYVGLPLAVEFGKKRDIIGYDLDEKRISDLRDNIDVTNETTKKELLDAKGLSFTSEIDDLKDCNCFIIAVPTPIDAKNKPNLKAVLGATEAVAKILKKNDISYGVYIFHMPIINFIIYKYGTGEFQYIVAIISTIIIGALSWVLIERPSLRMKINQARKI